MYHLSSHLGRRYTSASVRITSGSTNGSHFRNFPWSSNVHIFFDELSALFKTPAANRKPLDLAMVDPPYTLLSLSKISLVFYLVTGSRVFSLTCPLGSFGPELMTTVFQPNPRSKA
ncbi:hypothetical protein TNCV_3135781 [Trichonephila clavipes]|nr:hypothetical protein TNCV_3135781 [Trichonephila clavipes]